MSKLLSACCKAGVKKKKAGKEKYKQIVRETGLKHFPYKTTSKGVSHWYECERCGNPTKVVETN
jgi:hypothetical protein